MIIYLLLLLFVILTGLLGWFCFKLVRKMMFVSENMSELFLRLDEFDQHIKFIYELEMYYGDETLKNLIRHSRDLRDFMTNYKQIMQAFEDGDEVVDDEKYEDNETEDDEDDSENKEKFTRTGKALFYQGS
jgi:hypothetical protein